MGKSYLNYLVKNDKNIKLININLTSKYQKKNLRKNNLIFKGLFHRYIYPIVGVIYLWKLYFQSKKVLYLNYIPLWNFLIFIFLPPNSLIGPITGTIKKRKIYFLLNIFERISIEIIKLRFKKIIFSNNFFKHKYNLVGKKFKFNFILNDFRKNFNREKKDYDLIIYYRNISDKYNQYLFKLVNRLKKGNKIVTIGDNLYLKGIKNFGYVNRNKAKKIISKSSYALNNPENLYSFFFQDCMSYNLTIFYNKDFKKYNIFKNEKFIPITNTNADVDFNKINKKIN